MDYQVCAWAGARASAAAHYIPRRFRNSGLKWPFTAFMTRCLTAANSAACASDRNSASRARTSTDLLFAYCSSRSEPMLLQHDA